MEEKVEKIKSWLGTGAINIFGLPMSGKDTQGMNLAQTLRGKFISSGEIIRINEEKLHKSYSKNGNLIPQDVFYEWVLPYLQRPDLAEFPLILSSIGRWAGEENLVMDVAEDGGHPIKAAILLNISEADVETRYEAAKVLNDRGGRPDDKNLEIFRKRLEEFRNKTMPVILHYRALGLLISVNGDQTRDEVFNEIIEKLAEKAELN